VTQILVVNTTWAGKIRSVELASVASEIFSTPSLVAGSREAHAHAPSEAKMH
jgi:hypothetical protein